MFSKIFPKIILGIFIIQLFSSCSVIFSNRRDTYVHMNDIKKSFVIAKFNSGEVKTDYQEKYGTTGTETKVLSEIKTVNDAIVSGMRNHFDFSEFYFIEPFDARTLHKKQFDQLKVYDANMKPVNGEFLKGKYLYFLSFEGVYETPSVRIDENGDRRPVGGSDWYPGIAMLDNDLVQLINPFPHNALLPQRNYDIDFVREIKNYNRELTRWYQMHSNRIKKFTN